MASTAAAASTAKAIHTLSKPWRGLLIGAPGAGKGTHSTALVNRYPSLLTISSGDLLRQNIAAKTPLGLTAQTAVAKGEFVPDEVMIDLVLGELRARGGVYPDGYEVKASEELEQSWVLDGFPRTGVQAQRLDEVLEQSNAALNMVVHLEVPFDVILERIAGRWIHAPSGRVYNTGYNPPAVAGKDDVTGEPLTKRPDDNPETFKKRLNVFKDMTEPLLEYYEKQGVLFTARGPTSKIVWPQIEAEMKRRFE
ncbi:Adenylate kinase 2 [Saitoella coloradoensis]